MNLKITQLPSWWDETPSGLVAQPSLAVSIHREACCPANVSAAGMPPELARWKRALQPGLTALILAGTISAFAQLADPLNPNDFSAFKIISERNIFDPNRRPHVATGPAMKIVDSFSLVGTMIYGKGPFAVFDGTSSDYRKVLERGGTIAGYAVTDIRLDSVKLSSGTNQVEMKVGMQMRRNEDGQWSVGEQTESSGTSYAIGSPPRHSVRRQPDSTFQRNGPQTASSPALAPASGPDMADSTDASEGAESEITNAPPETASGDLNDPVARMMRRRAQELNVNDNRTPNQ